MNRRTLLTGGLAGTGLAIFGTPALRAAAALRSEIQSAIDAAFTAGGDRVDLGAGTLDVDAPLVIKTGVTLEGRGAGATTLRLASNAGTTPRSNRVIESRWASASGPAGSPAGTAWDDSIVIRNLTIDGNRANQPLSPSPSVALMNQDNSAAIVLDHCRTPLVEGVEIVMAKYRGLMVINSTQGSDDKPRVLNVGATYCGYTGIALVWTWCAVVQNCRAETCTRAGIYLEGCRYSTVGDNQSRNNLTTPIDGAGDGYGFVFDYFNGDSFVTATGNIATVNRSDGFLVSSDNLYSGAVLLNGNIATGNGAAGFHLWHAPNVVMGQNMSKWNVQDTTKID